MKRKSGNSEPIEATTENTVVIGSCTITGMIIGTETSDNSSTELKVKSLGGDNTTIISGSVDFTSSTLKNFWSGGTVTGTVGPSVLSLADIKIPLNATKHDDEEARYMNVNEINFDGIAPSEHSACIKYIEQNLGVRVFYPVAPEGDQATRIEGMKVIGLTSEGKYLVDGNIES